MKARLPKGYGGGPGNMNSMIKQAQKMQEDMAELQNQLAEKEYSAVSGGGMVEVTVNGKHEVANITIKPEVVDPDDIDMLQDLIIAAVNEAMRTADSDSEEQMQKITGGLNIPGMGGMF